MYDVCEGLTGVCVAVSAGSAESPSPGGFRRKGSTQRRVNSVYQRKSTAFLDVPSDKHSQSQAQEAEDEDSYRLRSFSFTSKGRSCGLVD